MRLDLIRRSLELRVSRMPHQVDHPAENEDAEAYPNQALGGCGGGSLIHRPPSPLHLPLSSQDVQTTLELLGVDLAAGEPLLQNAPGAAVISAAGKTPNGPHAEKHQRPEDD